MHADARAGQSRQEFLGQFIRAVAVGQDVDADPASGGGDQGALQVAADRVVEQDEGFDQHFAGSRVDRGAHRGKIGFAVLQQRVAVVAAPAQGRGRHSEISAAIGTWSDRRDQTREASGTGRQPRTLRT